MSIFDPTRGSYSLGGVLLGRNTLYGFQAVFTERGSSPSPVAAARILDTISRLPGMAGESNDAVSDYTQVRTNNEIHNIS